MKQEKSCGAVVYAETGRGRLYLVEKMLHGHFGLPKGHVEPGENERQTAEREILEETGSWSRSTRASARSRPTARRRA